MIDTSPDNLMREIEAGEKERDAALRRYTELLAMYLGQRKQSENLIHTYCSAMVPKIVIDNPRANVVSRKAISDSVIELFKMQAEDMLAAGAGPNEIQKLMDRATRPGQIATALKHGLNTWAEKENYRETLDRSCLDMLQAFSPLKSAVVKQPDGTRWPKSRAIAPVRYCADPSALHISEAEWQADWDVVGKAKLLERAKHESGAGWDAQAIESLTGAQQDNLDIRRDQVRVYEAWVRDYTEDGWLGAQDGIHGGLFTLATTMNKGRGERGAIQIRKPQPCFCPPWGPWVLIGAYVRSQSVYPLSPLLATFQQAKELDLHGQAISRSAAKYKRIVLVSDANPQLADDLANKPDLFVIRIKNEQFNKDQVVVVESGGVTDEQISAYNEARRRFERSLGLDDQQSGRVDADATATAVAVADESVQNRVAYMQHKFAAGVSMDLKAKAFYMAMEPRITFPLGSEAGEELSMLEPVFKGGVEDDDDFDFGEIEVEAYSMERTTEAVLQRRVLDAFQMLLTIAPTMIQMPWIDWKEVTQKIGDALNLPWFEEVIDFNMVSQMAQMGIAMGQQPGQTGSADGASRVSGGGGAPALPPGGQKPATQGAQARGGLQKGARAA